MPLINIDGRKNILKNKKTRNALIESESDRKSSLLFISVDGLCYAIANACGMGLSTLSALEFSVRLCPGRLEAYK